MTGHSKKFPPSGAWPICPSWENDGTSSPAAREGTKRHALLEQWLRWRINLAKDKGRWRWPITVEVDHGDGQGLQQDVIQAEDVQAVTSLIPYLDEHPAVANYGKPGHMVWVEEQVDYGSAFGRADEDFYGHSDIILVWPGTQEIFDAKFGHKIREPLSPQNKMYALGAGRLVLNAGLLDSVSQVKLTIGQPTNPAGPISSWEGSVDSLMAWRDEVVGWVKAREESQGTLFSPTEDACHFCLHRSNCPGRTQALAQMLEDVAPLSNLRKTMSQTDPWVIPAETPAPQETTDVLPAISSSEQISKLAESHAGREVGEIEPGELAKILDIAGQFKAFLADIEAEAKRRLNAGKTIPGWKLIAGKRTRKATVSDDEMIRILRETWKLPKEDIQDGDGNVTKQGIYNVKLKSLAQLEKVVTQLSAARQKKFASLWEMVPGSPILAPESDPATAVNPRPELLEGASEPQEPETPSWY